MKTIFRDRKIQTFISNSDVLDLQFLVFGQSGSCPFQFAQKSANFGRFSVIKKYHNLSQIWPEIGQKSQSFGLWAASVWPDSSLISNTYLIELFQTDFFVLHSIILIGMSKNCLDW